jgi:ABC-type xylose transport system permease subunit
MLFLNGPIYIVGSYFHAAFWRDETLRLNPNINVSSMVEDKLIIVFVIFAIITFSHYMTQKDLSVLIIQKHMIAN